MLTRRDRPTGLELYTRCAESSSAPVIGAYSTSFGMATLLFDARTRAHIRNVYALVRIADEIVDGSAAEAGLSTDDQRRVLDDLEKETVAALATGYSANTIVHAFAASARSAGIETELTAPFFASMRRDLDPAGYDADALSAYVHGSAEVVGLMCVRVFLIDGDVSAARRAAVDDGARRLGAAFQKVNFLRDLADDWTRLGRNYLPGVEPARLTDAERDVLVDDIAADLNAAAAVIPLLPRRCAIAVTAAHGLFRALAIRIRDTPVEVLRQRRVRVPATDKAGILLSAMLGRRPRKLQ